jgi:tripartite-type tricarboxylate transporter receptor subunit TctC
MKELNRRKFVALSGAAGLTMLAPGCSQGGGDAAAYPSRDITFIIPNGPGGNFDAFVRVIAPAMQKYLPNQVNIIPLNVPAGGGGKGLADLYRSRPDGYTIGAVNVPGCFTLQQQMGTNAFDLSEMTWLGTLAGGETYAVVVAPDSPINSLDDLRRLSAERPVKFASTGPEGTSYMAIKVASEIMGIRSQVITGYAGSSEYIIAAIRGDSDCSVATLSTLQSFIAGNAVKLPFSFESESSVPGVPSSVDIGLPELDMLRVERMVGAPPGLPEDIKQTLITALDQAVRDPDVAAWAREAGHPWVPEPAGNGAEVMQQQAAFFDKWKSVILS